MVQTGNSLDGFPTVLANLARSSPPKCFEVLVLIGSWSDERPKHPKQSCVEGL